jgi:hypothetical protein
MMKNITVISNDREHFVELTHHDSDPAVWIVRRSRKFMWFKKRISSDWFYDKQQALVFANEAQAERDKH